MLGLKLNRVSKRGPKFVTQVCWGADQRKNQSSESVAFVGGIHQWPVDSPHKGPVTPKMFPFDDVILIRHSAAPGLKVILNSLIHHISVGPEICSGRVWACLAIRRRNKYSIFSWLTRIPEGYILFELYIRHALTHGIVPQTICKDYWMICIMD